MLTTPGLYCISAKSLVKEIKYWVILVEGDSPSYNYEILTSKRFNNFKTKWYEVYDDINERYLCFDIDEYELAYEAAMTIENSSVNSSSGRYYYNDVWYDERVGLTAAMHDYVVNNNVKIVDFYPFAFRIKHYSVIVIAFGRGLSATLTSGHGQKRQS